MGITENKAGFSLGGECPTTPDCGKEICDWIGDYRECPIFKRGGLYEREVEEDE